ncbi:MAG TPA: hypothetical protein VIS06_13680 [Mycobacteriales bacterium]
MTTADAAPTDDASPRDDLTGLLAEAPPEAWGRTVLAVAAMHEPDGSGRCRYCRPDRRGWRWWRRPPARPCPTQRMLLTGITAVDGGPRWTAA